MSNLKIQKLFYVAVLFYVLLISGCAGPVKHMSSLPSEKVVTSPENGKAMIVFMRPSSLGFAVQSSVFEIKNDSTSIIGIVAAKKKIAYQVEPGEHLFMVVGESADFMSAELEADKTYYALVIPRVGAWKARFSLGPIHADGVDGPKNKEWLEACEWVEKSSASEKWANDNMKSIKSKQKGNYEKWMNKPKSQRPKLLPEDGKENITGTL